MRLPKLYNNNKKAKKMEVKETAEGLKRHQKDTL